ncbi:MAG TPA: PAAR domain-containing protein, partial [Kofleriaceae bacterium]|nr:PAAR domain-containing protein [Kofleriaceae bacterium]
MPPQGRLGDKAQVPADAHGCPACPHPAIGPAIAGSPTVLVNKRPALRVDDPGLHAACCGMNTWTAIEGSAAVFINDKAAHRMGDRNRHCGGIGRLIEGSPNVIVGDSSGGGDGGGGGAGGARDGAAGGAAGGRGGGAGGSGGTGGSGATGGGTDSGGDHADASGSGDGAADAGENPPAATPVDEHQLEVQLVNAGGVPQANVEYDLRLPDGNTRWGTTPSDGVIRLSGLTTAGSATLVLPDHDAEKGSTDGAHTPGATLYRAGGVEVEVGASTVVELQPRVFRGRLTGLMFDTDRTFVLPGMLHGIRLIKRLYDEHPGAQLLISGHADSVGGAEYNRGLSSERADAVAAYLLD